MNEMEPIASLKQEDSPDASGLQGHKRKRLAKACDACHKSKRRCDGTAPCGNCFYASKECSYTDHASGRAVAAPRSVRPGHQASASADARVVSSGSKQHPPQPTLAPRVRSQEASSSSVTLDQDEPSTPSSSNWKRARTKRDLDPSPTDHVTVSRGPGTSVTADRPPGLDASLKLELVNLFFTHCHPHRLIIHKPSFISDMAHDRVPQFLLLAVCALAAPYSKQPRLRTSPPSLAGRHFATDTTALMFDSTGRLLLKPSLALAQALCLLQIHHIRLHTPATESVSYHNLIPRILENLGVYRPDNPLLTPVPSTEFIHTTIERECTRRVFWLVYLMESTSAIYMGQSLSTAISEPSVRLPIDETSFELASHASLSEYLHIPAPHAQWASEFGHSLRITSILKNIELSLSSSSGSLSQTSIVTLNATLEAWAGRLPEHLRFSDESLQLQLSMFETGMNSQAWCFCYLHALHACCVLAIAEVHRQDAAFSATGTQWAFDRLSTIFSALGRRARNTMLLGLCLWCLRRHGLQNNPMVRAWTSDYEEFWSAGVTDFPSMAWDRPTASGMSADVLQQHEDALALVPPPVTPSQGSHSVAAFPPAMQLDSSTPRDVDNRAYRRISADGAAPESSQTNSGGMVDRGGPQALPSLKASGLLEVRHEDSSTVTRRSSIPAWAVTSNTRAEEHPFGPDAARNADRAPPAMPSWLGNKPAP